MPPREPTVLQQAGLNLHLKQITKKGSSVNRQGASVVQGSAARVSRQKNWLIVWQQVGVFTQLHSDDWHRQHALSRVETLQHFWEHDTKRQVCTVVSSEVIQHKSLSQ